MVLGFALERKGRIRPAFAQENMSDRVRVRSRNEVSFYPSSESARAHFCACQ